MRQDYLEITARDTEVLSIGPEGAKKFHDYWNANHIPFPGIPDEQHSVLKMYGQEVKLFKLGRMPAQMIVDKQGALRYIHYGEDMTDIPTTGELLGILDQLQAESVLLASPPEVT